MNLFDLVATLKLDTTGYEQGLNDAGAKAKAFGEKAGGFLKKGMAVLAGFTAGVTAVGVAFTNSAISVADYGDKVDKMSQKIGISAEAYQKWDYVMQRAGTNIDTLKMGMRTLSQQADKNAEEFQKLGISQEELATLSQEELFERTVLGLSKMESGTERAVIATKLLGRTGAELGPLLNQGSGAIEEQMEIAEKYGMIMPDSAVKASAAFKDSITTMQMTMTGLKNRLMGDFLPSLTQVTDGLAKVFTGDISGADDIVAGIDALVQNITAKMPRVMELGGKIVSGLAQAIMNSAPMLFKEGTKLITSFIGKLAKKLPEIISVGTDIITSIIDGIAESLPDLINAIPDIVVSFVTALVQNLPKIVESGGKLLISLVDGLIKAVPELVKQAPYIISQFLTAIGNTFKMILSVGAQIISKLAEGISNSWQSFKQKVSNFASQIPQAIKESIAGIVSIGKDIVTGLWNGISDKAKWLKDRITSWIGDIKSFLKKLFGISSPSKWAKEVIGGNIVRGLALGLEDGQADIQKSFDDLMPEFKTASYNVPKSENKHAVFNYSFNVYGGSQSPREIAEEVRRIIVREEQNVRMAWA